MDCACDARLYQVNPQWLMDDVVEGDAAAQAVEEAVL
jgi:hypothetical protein